MAPSDGFIVPLKSDPGAIWWYDAATMNPDAVKAFVEIRGKGNCFNVEEFACRANGNGDAC
jgi:hypothetical protein